MKLDDPCYLTEDTRTNHMPFLSNDQIWPTIRREAKRDGQKHVAVAYVTDTSGLNFRAGDSIVVDASDRCIRSGSTFAKELARLYRAGVRIFALHNLHAKVYILPQAVIVGSANLSVSSEGLTEAGFLDRSRATRQAAQTYLAALHRRAKLLAESDIRRLLAIKVERRGSVAPRRTGLPTLLEAFRQKDPVVSRIAFEIIGEDPAIAERAVREVAVASKSVPSGMAPSDWGWSVMDDKPRLSREISKYFSGKPGLALFADLDEEGAVARFTGVNSHVTTYLGTARLIHRGKAKRIQFDRIEPRSTHLTMGGPWRRELLAILNRGLRRDRKLARLLGDRTSGIAKPSELGRLFALGISKFNA